jgi:glycyl-tRNA synthetase beta subunit
MTDEELIARLQDEQPVTQDFQSTMKCELMDAAAKRIEELVKKNNNLIELAMDEHKRAETIEHRLTKQIDALERELEAIYEGET